MRRCAEQPQGGIRNEIRKEKPAAQQFWVANLFGSATCECCCIPTYAEEKRGECDPHCGGGPPDVSW